MFPDDMDLTDSLASYLEAFYAASSPVAVIRQNEGSHWLLSLPMSALDISDDNSTSVLRLGVPVRIEVTFMEPYPGPGTYRVFVPNEEEYARYGTPLITR